MLNLTRFPPRGYALALASFAATLLLWPYVLPKLLATDGFMPHGYCVLWQPSLIWLYAITDMLIGLAYVSIGTTLVYLVYRARSAIPFHGIVLAFGAFILACGGTHFVDVWTLWTPVYWFAGGAKVATAIASVVTALVLPPLVPKALGLIHTAQIAQEREERLVRAYQELQSEIAERKRVEVALRASQARLAGILDIADDAIISVDSTYRIQLFNQGAERIFGYAAPDILGQSLDLLLPARLVERHHRHIAAFRESSTTAMLMGRRGEIFGRRSDATEFPAEASISQLDQGGETAFTVILRDITSRKRVEEGIAASLSEKEALLKEIHHRVKNNLQIISSLLKFQSRYIKDQQALDMFSESQNRVKSMALIHEKLYQSHDFSRIDFAEYIKSLARWLLRSYGIGNAIALTIDADPMTLDIDRATSCGLIINELLTNALKYAFPAGQAGTITIRLRSNGADHFTLAIGDTGIGLPEGFDLAATTTLGLQLVSMMTRQLQGTLELDTSAGTRFILIT